MKKGKNARGLGMVVSDHTGKYIMWPNADLVRVKARVIFGAVVL